MLIAQATPPRVRLVARAQPESRAQSLHVAGGSRGVGPGSYESGASTFSPRQNNAAGRSSNMTLPVGPAAAAAPAFV